MIIKGYYSIDRTTISEIIAEERKIESRKKEQERQQGGMTRWKIIV